MSENKKPSYIDTKLAEFTQGVDDALRKERQQRAEDNKAYDAKLDKERQQRAEDNKAYDAKLDKERQQRAEDNKAYDAKLDKERKQRAEDNKAYDAKLDKERQQRAEDNKAYDAKLDKERKQRDKQRAEDQKAFDAKMEQHRREFAVKMGELQEMWGKLAEFVIKSGILDTLNRHGDLSVTHTLPNVAVRYKDEDGKLEHGEFDIIVTGERDIVIVETKTTLEAHDVNYFVKKYLQQYPRWEASSPYINLPSCEGMRVFGCLAYMKAGSTRAEELAVEHGLITVHAFGDSSDLAHPDTVLVDYHPER